MMGCIVCGTGGLLLLREGVCGAFFVFVVFFGD